MMIVGVVVAVMPWANAMLQRLTHEQALKEREEERADMTAHLHDGRAANVGADSAALRGTDHRIRPGA